MRILLLSLSLLTMSLPIQAAVAQDFNPYVLKAVRYLYDKHRGGGYDIGSAFTHEIPYGGGIIKPTSPKRSMCVAGVSEVMVYATKIYADERNDQSVFNKVPLSAWMRGNQTSLRANIFMFQGTGSRGTGHTLARYRLGEERPFEDLKAGDFVNFNRSTRSGHAVVFLGYLDGNLQLSPTYSDQTKGFRYFSLQGKGQADAGFAYRDAFFGDFCPSAAKNPCVGDFCPVERAVPRDCRLIRSRNPVLLNSGRMWDPARWDYVGAVEDVRSRTRSIIESLNPGSPTRSIDSLLDQQVEKGLAWSREQRDSFDMVEAE